MNLTAEFGDLRARARADLYLDSAGDDAGVQQLQK